jgi:hypothetical protein
MIDDKTAAYIIQAQKHFEDLRQVAAQLAGRLVLEAAGSKRAMPDTAEELYKSAADGLRSVRPTARARRHHEALLIALSELGTALSLAETGDSLVPLKAAYAQLQSASHRLPGFELISFEQCCCQPQRQK